MAQSYVLYNGTGVAQNLTVPFGYIDEDHVLVLVDDVEVSFTWVNATTVQATTTVGTANVRVKRRTPRTALVSFTDGSGVLAADLNLQATQARYIAEEQEDAYLENALTDLSVDTSKIANLAVTTAKINDLAVTTGKLADASVTLTKMADLATRKVIGRLTGSPGVPEAVSPDDLKVVSDGASAERDLSARFRERFNVLDEGADNTGTNDCSTAVLAAFTAAGSTGEVHFPKGRYRFSSAVTLPSSGVRITGSGDGTVLVKDDAAASIFYASAKTGIKIRDMRFEVASGTVAYLVTNSLVNLLNCHFLDVRGCTFYALNGSSQPCLYGLLVNSQGSDATVIGNTFQGAYGNCAGCLDEGSGTGKRHIYVGNRFIDFVDTGLGLWTGAKECTVVGNYFRALPTATAPTNYTRVCIDMAGVSDSVISGNVFVNGTQQVRCLTNIGYTNKNNIISNNQFLRPEATSSVTPTCLNVSHSDTQEMSVAVLNNYFYITGSALSPTSNVCVQLVSTNSTGVLIAEINGNTFDGDGTGRAVTAQGVGSAGRIRFVPGSNYFKLAGATPIQAFKTGSPTLEVSDRSRNKIAHAGAGWGTINFNNSATANVVWKGRIGVGIYAVRIRTGAMTDVAAGVTASFLGDASYVFAQSQANSYVEQLVAVQAEVDTNVGYTSHPAGNNYTFESVEIVRLV